MAGWLTAAILDALIHFPDFFCGGDCPIGVCQHLAVELLVHERDPKSSENSSSLELLELSHCINSSGGGTNQEPFLFLFSWMTSLVVEPTHLKNISRGENKKYLSFHHLDDI